MFIEHQISLLDMLIFEGSCVDAENSALHHRNKLHF